MQNNPLAAISLLVFLCESEAEHASQKNFYIGLCMERFVVVNSQQEREKVTEKDLGLKVLPQLL